METLFEYSKSHYNVTYYKDNCVLNPPDNNDELFGVSLYRPPLNDPRFPIWDYHKSEKGEEVYVKNYGNPLCSLNLYRGTIVIVKKEDKITIKIFDYIRTRGVNKPYFRVSTNVEFFTYNFKRHIMYVGGIKNYHKKRKFTKKIKITNTGEHPLAGIKSKINTLNHSSLYNGEFTHTESINFSEKVLEIFISNLPGIEKYKDIFPLEQRFYKYHLESKGVKLPNNWTTFIHTYPQPLKKVYVKNDYKYIDSIMEVNKLSGTRIRKILHTLDHFDPNTIKSAFYYYGEDYIMNQSDEFLYKIFKSNITNYNVIKVNEYITNKQDLKNSFEIFKLAVNGNIHEQTFIDHIRMYSFLKRFEPIKWEAKTYLDFSDEHIHWTELQSFYTNGTYERTYSDEFSKNSQSKIEINNETYYPVLLKKSDEYNKESFIQSNCVKGYISRAASLIISLRKDDNESKERATIEYRISGNDKNVELRRVQTLGRFNNVLPKEWDEPIKILDENLNKLLKEKKFTLPKLKVIYKMGEIETEGIFSEESYNKELIWKDRINF
jgi:hypothetical protein